MATLTNTTEKYDHINYDCVTLFNLKTRKLEMLTPSEQRNSKDSSLKSSLIFNKQLLYKFLIFHSDFLCFHVLKIGVFVDKKCGITFIATTSSPLSIIK
jgi:hypothetical protein